MDKEDVVWGFWHGSQGEEHLLSKCKSLTSTPNIAKRKEQKRKKKYVIFT
jgi:hypothetical protein